MSKMEVSDVLAYGASVMFKTTIFLITNMIALINKSFDTFPEVTGTVLAIIFMYILFRLMLQTLKFIYRMFINMLKTVFWITMIFSATLVYLRGYKFFTQDIYYAMDTIKRLDIDKIQLPREFPVSFQTFNIVGMDGVINVVRSTFKVGSSRFIAYVQELGMQETG